MMVEWFVEQTGTVYEKEEHFIELIEHIYQ